MYGLSDATGSQSLHSSRVRGEYCLRYYSQIQKATNMNENRRASQQLMQARSEALDQTAAAYRCILKQHELTIEEEIEGMHEIGDAVSCAEEAIFYLAIASSEDDQEAKQILDGYGLGRLYSDLPPDVK